jgi:hypothetical protein
MAMEHCKVCKKPLPLEDRTVMAAFGKPLFVCHKKCSVLVQGGVATATRVALAAGAAVMKTRAPKTLKALTFLRTVVQEQRALGATPGGTP